MNDITPKEAIANLNHLYGMVAPDIQRSLDVAIKALERPSGDCISREALKGVIETYRPALIYNNKTDMKNKMVDYFLDEIDNAPPVETFTLEDMQNNYDAGVDSVIGKYDKAKGEWVDHSETDGYVECPFCGSLTTCESNKEELHFCWNCGADMRPKGGKE